MLCLARLALHTIASHTKSIRDIRTFSYPAVPRKTSHIYPARQEPPQAHYFLTPLLRKHNPTLTIVT